MTSVERMNTLFCQTTETAFETASFMQRQNAQLLENWLSVVETSQKTIRDLTLKAIKQGQEAQGLWMEFVQESFDTGVDNVTTFTQNGLKETSERIEKASRQAKAEKPAEAHAK